MYERKYVTQMLDYYDEGFVSGVIYRAPQSTKPYRDYLESHLAIKEVN